MNKKRKKIQPPKVASSEGVAEKFRSALGDSFAPLISALGATALTGTVEGAQAGFEAQEGIQKMELERGKEQRMMNPTFQQSQQVLKGTEEPLVFNPKSGVYQRMDGSPVSGEDIADAITLRQQKSLDLGYRKQTLSEAKAQELSPAQVGQVADLNTTLQSVDAIDRLLETTKVNTGPLAGPIQGLGKAAGFASNDFINLEGELNQLNVAFRRATTGLTASDQERAELKSMLPKVSDDEKVLKQKLLSFKIVMDRHREEFLKAIRTGQPLKKEVINDIVQVNKQVSSSSAQNPINRPANTLTSRPISAYEAVKEKKEAMTPREKRQLLLQKRQNRGL